MSGILTPVDDSRACPFCGETIKRVALKCRHCGELLGDPDSPGVFRKGDRVVVSKTTALPWRCVKTNEPTDLSLDRKLYWHSPLVYVLLLLGPIPYAIGAVVARKQHKMRVPLSASRLKRRRRGIAIGWLLILGGLGAIFGGIAVGSGEDNGSLGAGLAIGGVVSLIVGIFWAVVASNPINVARIDDDYVWLRGFDRRYLAELPEFPGKL